MSRLERQNSAGAEVTQQILQACGDALKVLNAVQELSARSTRKHVSLMSPWYAASRAIKGRWNTYRRASALASVGPRALES